jgi:hypothetical protein
MPCPPAMTVVNFFEFPGYSEVAPAHRHDGAKRTVSLADGNAVWSFFHLNQISERREFEAGIRQLMSQFVVGEHK